MGGGYCKVFVQNHVSYFDLAFAIATECKALGVNPCFQFFKDQFSNRLHSPSETKPSLAGISGGDGIAAGKTPPVKVGRSFAFRDMHQVPISNL